MNSPQDFSLEERPNIHITDSVKNKDGSTTVNYVINHKVLELCAKENEKELTELTEEEIHRFVSKNIGNALNCHGEWEIKFKSS